MRRAATVVLAAAALLCAVSLPAHADDDDPTSAVGVGSVQACDVVGNVLGSHSEQGDCGS